MYLVYMGLGVKGFGGMRAKALSAGIHEAKAAAFFAVIDKALGRLQ